MDQAVWLAQVNETVLDPDLPICDPHHHLWDHPGSRYLLDELLGDTGSGHNVVSTVFVECASMYRADGPDALKPVGETEFVNRHAVGWDAADSVRNSHTNPTQGLLLDSTFRKGFAELGKRGLSFDAWLYHPQIPQLTDLARAFPGTTIILDHFGGPLGVGPYEGKRAEIFVYWKEAIRDLAACPNVVAKLGGIAMPINGFGFHKRERPATSAELVAATGDYYRHAIDCFGPQRCMFESNFPVDKASCSYRTLWNSFKKIAAGASASEKAALFHNTAARVYRL
ncbi:MAG: amidohydrolase family protein [Proteobacteria bacterium]|nr:amidohydrolase family protein [Pseudomonadota bacterium]